MLNSASRPKCVNSAIAALCCAGDVVIMQVNGLHQIYLQQEAST
jgi:hypothetical protein